MKFRKFQILSALFLICLAAIFQSCETGDISPQQIASGKEYFPYQIGNYWIYRIDTITYTPNGDVYSGGYFRKDIISDTLPDQEGSKVFRVEIYKTVDTTSDWEIDSVWSFRVDNDKILYTENNKPIVKLKFPLQNGNRWDGNAFNPEADSSGIFWFSIAKMGKPFIQADSTRFEETLTVLQKVDENSINKSNFYEVYGKNIGLIFWEKTFLIYESPVSTEIGAGTSRKCALIRYGKE